jgi:hypothetical protein
MGLFQQVHAVLVSMLRGHPDLILDSCSVRAKRGGDLTGPNPTDRAKQGTKYNVAVTGEGVPVACLATPAHVNDTLPLSVCRLGDEVEIASPGPKAGERGCFTTMQDLKPKRLVEADSSWHIVGGECDGAPRPSIIVGR